MNKARLLAALLAVSFAGRMIYCWALSPYDGGAVIDNIDNYNRFARNLRDEFFFGLDGEVRANREPGYPLALAALYTVFGESYATVWTFHALLGTLTVLLIFLLGREVFGERAAWTAALFAAVYPQFIYYTAYPSRETLQVFLLTAAVWATLRACREPRARAFVLAGALWAFCPLVNSVFLPAAVAAAGAIWHFGRRLRRDHRKWSALFLGVCLGVYGLWPLRNYLVFDRFIAGITEGAIHLYVGFVVPNWASGTPDEVKFMKADPVVQAGRNLTGAERDRYYYAAAKTFILRNPGKFLRIITASFIKMWRFYPYQRDYLVSYRKVFWISLLSDAWLIPLGLLGLILAGRKFPETDLINLTLLLVTGVYMIFWATIRYRLPLMPFVLLYDAYALGFIADKLKSRGS